MPRFGAALALAATLLAAPTALANGRFPGSRGVAAQGERWMVPVTFGMLVSNDGGDSFQWLCEDALGYAGTYDPDLLIDAAGNRWITAFDGVRVSRDDGCEWTPVGAPFDGLFPGAMTADSQGRLWVASAQAGVANGIYRLDDTAGTTFARLGLDSEGALFTGVATAPSMSSRVFVSGFVIATNGQPEPLLFRTDDDGLTFNPLGVDAFDIGDQPSLEVRAVGKLDPDLVLVTVGRTPGNGGDQLFRSINGGDSFELVLTIEGGIEAVLTRSNGDVVVGAGSQGTWISEDGGDSFTQVVGGPLLTCAVEQADGSLLGCASNVAPDLFAVGSSTDARAWTRILTFDAITGPLECPSGTPQKDSCEALWPGLAEQLGISSGSESDAGIGKPPTTDGCGCRSATGSGAFGAAGGLLLLLLLRRRASRAGKRCW